MDKLTSKQKENIRRRLDKILPEAEKNKRYKIPIIEVIPELSSLLKNKEEEFKEWLLEVLENKYPKWIISYVMKKVMVIEKKTKKKMMATISIPVYFFHEDTKERETIEKPLNEEILYDEVVEKIEELTEVAGKHIEQELRILAKYDEGFKIRIQNIRSKFKIHNLRIEEDILRGGIPLYHPEKSSWFWQFLTEEQQEEFKDILQQFTKAVSPSRDYFDYYYVWILNHILYPRDIDDIIFEVGFVKENFDIITLRISKPKKPLTSGEKKLYRIALKLAKKEDSLAGWEVILSLSHEEFKKMVKECPDIEEAIGIIIKRDLSKVSKERIIDLKKAEFALKYESYPDPHTDKEMPLPEDIKKQKQRMKEYIERVKKKYKGIEKLPLFDT